MTAEFNQIELVGYSCSNGKSLQEQPEPLFRLLRRLTQELPGDPPLKTQEFANFLSTIMWRANRMREEFGLTNQEEEYTVQRGNTLLYLHFNYPMGWWVGPNPQPPF